ncbi:MAG TPA: phage portal protein [Desulfosporosinus sp.]|nr:phage portal protein [Desulfosporosinus sp.]
MPDLDLLAKCKEEHDLNSATYQKMQDYYDGNGKTDALVNYKMITSRANNKIPKNMVQKFILEEVSYCVANGIIYSSHSNDKAIIDDIRLNIVKSWSEKHDGELLKQALIFSEAYELIYADKQAQFKAMILNPLNSYVLKDEFGEVRVFIRFFQKKFEPETQYADVYEGNKIYHYTVDGGKFTQYGNIDSHIFSKVPVGVCSIGSIYESIYGNIKGQQDGYEQVSSDYVNEIADARNAILLTTGASVEEGAEEDIKTKAIMELPTGGDAKWLIKTLSDAFIQNALNTLNDNMYSLANHIDHNQKLSSNTSSLAQKNKLMGLASKCANNIHAMQDCIKMRLQFLFEFLKIKQSKNYSYLDVDIKLTPSIPTDDLMVSQILSQNPKIPTEVGFAQYSFIQDVDKVMALYEEENKANSVGENLLNNDNPPNGGVE